MRNWMTIVAAAVVLVGAANFVKAEDAKKPVDVEAVFKHKDTNGDGKLSVEEFVGKLTGEKADKAKERFTKLDKDGDGSLSLDEFKAGMEHAKKAEK
ncbi:MAG: hypothetical protein GC162_20800 [Planctomycetes bacterium]|nr:hypothetical protein [Planctomycetota bacterium]